MGCVRPIFRKPRQTKRLPANSPPKSRSVLLASTPDFPTSSAGGLAETWPATISRPGPKSPARRWRFPQRRRLATAASNHPTHSRLIWHRDSPRLGSVSMYTTRTWSADRPPPGSHQTDSKTDSAGGLIEPALRPRPLAAPQPRRPAAPAVVCRDSRSSRAAAGASARGPMTIP